MVSFANRAGGYFGARAFGVGESSVSSSEGSESSIMSESGIGESNGAGETSSSDKDDEDVGESISGVGVGLSTGTRMVLYFLV